MEKNKLGCSRYRSGKMSWAQSLVVVGIAILTLLALNPISEAQTITVGHTPGADYWNIQDAINASNDGDTIIVWYGVYNEHIVINKSLTIKSRDGASSTFINGMGSGTVIYVIADDVTIDGFTVDNGEIGIKISSDNTVLDVTDMFIEGMGDGTGIAVSADNVTISGFTIWNSDTGIKLSSNDSSVSNNNIMNLKSGSSAFGIYLYGYNNAIFNNTILSVSGGGSYGGYGIYLNSATNAIISNNTITSVSGGEGYAGSDCSDLWCSAGDGSDGGIAIGIYVTSSPHPTILSNTISNIFGGIGGRGGNGDDYYASGGDGGDGGYAIGMYLRSAAHSTIDNNMISGVCGGNGGSGGYSCFYGDGGDGGDGRYATGMYLESAAYSTIDNNMISGVCGGSGGSGGSGSGNPSGLDGTAGTSRNIYLTSSSSNTITHNSLSTSDYGFYLTTGSVMNFIYHNNIINSSTKGGYDSGGSNGWDCGPIIGGNYWSDYVGEDNNGDGIGDTPYELAGGIDTKDYYPFMNESGWLINDTTPPASVTNLNGT